MRIFPIFALAAALTGGPLAYAQDYKTGNLRITQAYARPTVVRQPTGAAYLTMENAGVRSDRLTGATTPIAKSVELHTMSMEGNVMRMREVSGIELEPSGKVAMKPGEGFHLMLMGLRKPLSVGDTFPLTLTFERAGKLVISVKVEESGANSSNKHGGHGGHPR